MKIFLFPTLILNLDLFHELFPFNAGKTVIFMKSATEVYCSSSSVQNLIVATTKLANILSAIKLSSDLLQGSNIYIIWEI
jgi:hypothetical protein